MLLLAAVSLAQDACTPLAAPPERLQVAWVSPEAAHVGLHQTMIVVSSRALLAAAEERARDPAAVLAALGVTNPSGDWKVTLFDVDRAELCRPMAGEGAEAGLNRCDHARRPTRVRARAWTGCGYLDDALSAARTLDVYGVEWADAADQGFCVMPLTRYLQGPPK